MSAVRENISKSPALSWRKLVLIFLLALLMLAIFRFDADALVRDKLAETGERSGWRIDFDQMTINGLSADFSHVSMSSKRLSEALIFEQVEVSPVWHSLLSESRSADVIVMWQGNSLAATLVEADKGILTKHLQLKGSAAKLSRLLIPYLQVSFPLSVSGDIVAEGEARFDRFSGMPDSGLFNVKWGGAKAGAMGAEFALGDLMMELQGEAGQWRWRLDDGGVGMVDANGSLQQLSTLVEFWPVQGTVVIDTAKISDPYLIAWLPEMGDEKKIRLRLSGTLSRPRLDRIK